MFNSQQKIAILEEVQELMGNRVQIAATLSNEELPLEVRETLQERHYSLSQEIKEKMARLEILALGEEDTVVGVSVDFLDEDIEE